MPSISASPTGAVFVKWYDRRDTANNDYWIYGRASIDNGVTWQADQAVSDAVIPQPIVQTANCYMGDYDYHSSNGITNLVTWTDSRGAGSGGTQDVYFDKVPVVPVATPTPGITQTPTPTPTPIPTPTPSPTPCGTNYTQTTGTGAAIVPGTTFVTGSNCDDCVNAITLPFTFRLYNQPFSTVNASSNGNLQFNSAITDYINACLPYPTFDSAILPHWDDMLLTGTNQGIYTSTSGTAPNRIFNIEWTGGYFSGGGTADFEVRLYETTNQIDLVYGVVTQTGTSATIGLQKDTGSVINQFSCNTSTLSTGFRVTYVPTTCGTPSPSPTVSPSTPTPSPTPSASPSPGCTPVWTAGAIFPPPPPAVVRGQESISRRTASSM